MNVEEVISSGLLETFVLGICTDEEIVFVNSMHASHSEIKNEIELIEDSLLEFGNVSPVRINPFLKEKITHQLFSGEGKKVGINTTKSKINALNKPNNSLTYYRIGIAASLLLLVASSFYILMLSNKVNSLNGRVAELNNTKTYLTDMLDAQQTSLSSIRANLDFVSDPKVKTVALRGMNTLVSKIATVHWNTETHEVIFNAKGLPQNTVSKQYQLWAIVNGKPVDAGVIILTNGVAFQKMKPIEGAQAFAVTIEKAGGSDTPTLDTMCLLGNV